MRIGIIGMGMVGEAVAFGLKRIGHHVVGYDILADKCIGSWDDVLGTELVFVCTPTPITPDLRCCTHSVWSVVLQLNMAGYPGLIVIKSTVTPGTTERLQATFPEMKLAFCPEFLRERARFYDFYENMEVCIVGTFDRSSAELIAKAHGSIPKSFVEMTPMEAELAKYFVNCFNAYRINFANAFFDVCEKLGADYQRIKDTVTMRKDTNSAYLDSNPQFRSFGGACLPKDTRAFATFVKELKLMTGLFREIVIENERVRLGWVRSDESEKVA